MFEMDAIKILKQIRRSRALHPAALTLLCVARTSSEADEIEQWYAAAAERTAFLAGPVAFAFSAVYGTRDWICYVYGVACSAIADYYAASRQLYR